MNYSPIQHIPCWGFDVAGFEWMIWLRRVEAYEPMLYWRNHPAREAALANAIGFASKGRSNV